MTQPIEAVREPASEPAARWGRWGGPPSVAGGLWVHAASVGDVRAIDPLLRHLAARAVPWALSVQTAPGRGLAHKLWPQAAIGAPPIDCPPWPERALRRARPAALILEYLELWPAWIAACARLKIPVIVLDGRVSERSLRVRRLLRPTAARLSWFCAQSAQDAEGAIALGVPEERVSICGVGKHDQLLRPPPMPSEALRAAVGGVDVVLGSLHEDEEGAALTSLAGAGLRALIAPRYLARVAALERLAQRLGVPTARRSEGGDPQARWILLDSIGELAAAYALAPAAVMGGSFGRRQGQNLVEAAAHGRPVIFGPQHANIALEAEALRGRAAFEVVDWPQAWAQARRLGRAPFDEARARAALHDLTGATARHVQILCEIVPALAAQLRGAPSL